MRLRELVKLQSGDVISCSACDCKGDKVKIVRSSNHILGHPCGCELISHERSIFQLVAIFCSDHDLKWTEKDCNPSIVLSDGRTAYWFVINKAGRSKIKLISKG